MVEATFATIRKHANPLRQFVFSLGLGAVGMLISKAVVAGPVGKEFFAALVALIFYTLINIAASVAFKSYMRYTMPSFYLYIALVIILFLSARLLSGISIWTLNEYRMMLISISIFYFVASNMVRGVKAIYDVAEDGF